MTGSPFKFLDPFTLADKDVFFGREKETQLLYRQVQRTRLLILYGLSGTGKTSLIQCGLAGKFAGPDWLPLWIRHQSNINDSLQTAIKRLLPEAEGSISVQIRRLYQYFLRPVYLIFDQFEELFILGEDGEQKKFITTLKTILDDELPCTILIVIREEYLGQLYPFEKAISTLFDYRLRVESMDNANVKTVLRESFQKFNIEVEGENQKQKEERLEEIIQNVSLGRSGIELPYLQVYLDQLYRDDFRRTYPGQTVKDPISWPRIEFTKQEISDFGKIDKVLTRYLDEQLERIQLLLVKVTPVIPADTVKLILNGFISDEKTKRPVRYKRTEGENGAIKLEMDQRAFFPKLSPQQLTLCFDELEKAKFLRFEPDTIEIAHDSLAEIIYGWRTDEQRERDNFKNQIRLAAASFPKTGEYLTQKQIAKFEDVVTELEPVEANFFNKSKEFRNEEKNKELLIEKNRREEVEKALVTAREALKKNKRIIDAFYFYEDRFALAFRKTINIGKYGFINKEGNIEIDYKYDKATQFEEDGYARVEIDREIFLLDAQKNEYRLALDIKKLDKNTAALDLHDKELKVIPSFIFECSSIKILLLYGNYINSLPDQIDKLINLETLDLSRTPLTVLPDQIGQLINLQKLDLSETSLTALPKQIGQLINLQKLDLGATPLTALPDQIGQLTNLRTLNLRFNRSLNALPKQIGELINLQTLDLSRTSLSALPDQIGQLTNLQTLDLRYNRFLTALPEQIGQLKSLQILYLSETPLTALPKQIGQLFNLQILYLISTSLTSLPEQIGQLYNLQTLDLRYNRLLTGIPDQIGDLKSLQSLNLSGVTSLTSLPNRLWDLKSLQSLNLGYNTKLTSLPERIGNLTSLQSLDLRGTSLTDTEKSKIKSWLPNCEIIF